MEFQEIVREKVLRDWDLERLSGSLMEISGRKLTIREDAALVGLLYGLSRPELAAMLNITDGAVSQLLSTSLYDCMKWLISSQLSQQESWLPFKPDIEFKDSRALRTLIDRCGYRHGGGNAIWTP